MVKKFVDTYSFFNKNAIIFFTFGRPYKVDLGKLLSIFAVLKALLAGVVNVAPRYTAYI